MNGKVICINDTIRYVGKDVGEVAWSKEEVATGATNEYDGRVNMAIIKKISGWKDLYPAFALCDALNTGNVTGWYLPAKKELYDIYNGGYRFDYYYWSSTENGIQAFIFYSNSYSRSGYTTKKASYKVKAVHRF